MANLEHCVVKIFKCRDGAAPEEAAGTGVLVSEDLVLTCAHVVAAAIGCRNNEAESRVLGRAVDLELYSLKRSKSPFVAEVAAWRPCRSGGSDHQPEDIAVLRLKRKTRFTTPLEWLEWQRDAAGVFFGFGKRHSYWIDCKFMGDGEHWVQLNCEKHEAEPGYSGGPVFDPAHKRLMGILVVRDEGNFVAKMIPAATLQEVLREVPPCGATLESVGQLASPVDALTRMLDRREQCELIKRVADPYGCFLVEGRLADLPHALAERLRIDAHLEEHGLDRLPVEADFDPVQVMYSPNGTFLQCLEKRLLGPLRGWLTTAGPKVVQIHLQKGAGLIPQVEWVVEGLDQFRGQQLPIQHSLVVLLILHVGNHGVIERWRLRRSLNAKQAQWLPRLACIEPRHLVTFEDELPTKALVHFKERFKHTRVRDELYELGSKGRKQDYRDYRDAAKRLRRVLASNYLQNW